jgi:hypothetical protein
MYVYVAHCSNDIGFFYCLNHGWHITSMALQSSIAEKKDVQA